MKISNAKIKRLIEEATVDAYNESEQLVGFLTMIEDSLALPFTTRVLDVEVLVERIDMTAANELVAVCRRGRTRQAIPILELPLPRPAPKGAEWIEAYRRWAKGG
ncbi:MAG: hypothetical protein FJY54_08555 [Betaproteobacteria bacterium]|nr:hypothetical protein [Betaproteobacteria bacterium]